MCSVHIGAHVERVLVVGNVWVLMMVWVMTVTVTCYVLIVLAGGDSVVKNVGIVMHISLVVVVVAIVVLASKGVIVAVASSMLVCVVMLRPMPIVM